MGNDDIESGPVVRAQILSLKEIEPVACPCGFARRAFGKSAEAPVSVHYTQITRAARTHYHREHHEVYVVLSCEAGAAMELDGVLHPLEPLMAVSIPPFVRHRAIGEATIINIVSPPFDPADEWFDPAPAATPREAVHQGLPPYEAQHAE